MAERTCIGVSDSLSCSRTVRSPEESAWQLYELKSCDFDGRGMTHTFRSEEDNAGLEEV